MLLFESDAFPVQAREDDQTNPGIFGRALAEWVGQRLRAQGLPAEAVIAEDFGWCVPVRLPPHAVYVACANGKEDPASTCWQLFVFAEGGLLKRLFGTDTRREALDRVFRAVRHTLESAPEIHHLIEEPAES